jgi:hypothetical protein
MLSLNGCRHWSSVQCRVLRRSFVSKSVVLSSQTQWCSKGRDVVFMPRLRSMVLIGGDTCHPWKVKARLHFLAARTCNCTAQQKGIVRIRTASTYPQPLDQPLTPPSPRLEPLGSFTTYLQSSLSKSSPSWWLPIKIDCPR